MEEKDDRYKGLTWLTDASRAHLIYLDQLVEKQDLDAVFKLEGNSEFSTTLHRILVKKYGSDPNSLNKVQLNLFLSMHLENSGQSCGILGCLQEWYPEHLNKFVPALRDLCAWNSADVIEKAIKLLPKDGSWFHDKANKETQDKFEELDKQFSDYPDGFMPKLYRSYADKNREKIYFGISNRT